MLGRSIKTLGILMVLGTGVVGLAAAVCADESPEVEPFLLQGRLAAGEAALAKELKADPQDDQVRFGLGVLQVMRGVERGMQSLHRYGLRTGSAGGWLTMLGFPLGRLPVPPNAKPEELTYEQARAILQQFIDDLQRAEATLAGIKSPDVKLPLHIGLVRLDFDGDGQAVDEETFWRIYARLTRGTSAEPIGADDFVIGFDRADAEWLRGYCHLLMALGEFHLAYDSKDAFERTAHLLFPRVKTPHSFLLNAGSYEEQFPSYAPFLDLMAAVHLINFELVEPQRPKAALAHFEAVIAHSRKMWEFATAETDDDNEWIPSPKQTGVLPGVRFTPEMIAGWHSFLDEAEAILKGKKLIPFWRDAGGRGLNLRRVFTEPRRFDLVLWVQGTAATPYLEEGELTRPETWNRFQDMFQGNFIGFALYVN